MLQDVERRDRPIRLRAEEDTFIHVILRGSEWEVTVANQVVQSGMRDEAEARHIAEDLAEELGLSIVTHAGGPAA